MEQPPWGGWRGIFSNERVTRNLWMPKLDTGAQTSLLSRPSAPRSFSYLKLLFTWRPFHLPPVLLSFILFFGPFNSLSANYCHRFFVREVAAAASARYRPLSTAYFSQWNLPTAGSVRNGSSRSFLPSSASLCKTRRLIKPNSDRDEKTSASND